VIGYYALGGGLGHLARARKVLAALDLEATLITASGFAGDARVTGGRPVRLIRSRREIPFALAEFDELIVDSFPGGLFGELCGLPLPPARHVARRLQWAVYARRLRGELPQYELVYDIEPLAPEHDRELAWFPRVPLALAHAEPGEPLVAGEHTLVVHTGPQHEIDALVARASGRIVVVRDVFPIEPHLAHATHIVTAAGFNLMHETRPYRDRHTFVPFARALDDQFARA
jgi:predicted glycosyltransferase